MRPMTSLALGGFRFGPYCAQEAFRLRAVLVACRSVAGLAPSGIFLLLLVGGLSRSLSFATMGALAFARLYPRQSLLPRPVPRHRSDN